MGGADRQAALHSAERSTWQWIKATANKTFWELSNSPRKAKGPLQVSHSTTAVKGGTCKGPLSSRDWEVKGLTVGWWCRPPPTDRCRSWSMGWRRSRTSTDTEDQVGRQGWGLMGNTFTSRSHDHYTTYVTRCLGGMKPFVGQVHLHTHTSGIFVNANFLLKSFVVLSTAKTNLTSHFTWSKSLGSIRGKSCEWENTMLLLWTGLEAGNTIWGFLRQPIRMQS